MEECLPPSFGDGPKVMMLDLSMMIKIKLFLQNRKGTILNAN